MSDQADKAPESSIDVELSALGALPEGELSGLATTAIGPGDVRDTPRIPPVWESQQESVDPWIGRVLSNVYRVEAKLGEGGMGAVYTARHVHLNKQYAVKVLGASVATNSTAVERLKQEAIAASSIEHDNIVEVISFDRYADGAVFILMELLRGESLADRVARGPIPLHAALAIAHAICAALGAAHARGIVHRDLKPENVFLARKGEIERVKVLDFGISKVKSADAEQVKMTRTGQLVGTPLYMSPEQARGEADIDRRVDIYALGVILYEMLTGSPPFEGRNYFELLWKHGNEAPQSLTRRNPNVHIPDEVDAVVLRALAKTREARFQTMEELAAALRAAAPDVPVPASGTSLPPSRPSEPAQAALRDAPARDTTESMPAPPIRGVPPWVVGAVALVLIGIATIAIAMRNDTGTGTRTESRDPDPALPDPVAPPEPAVPGPVADPIPVPVPDPVPVAVEVSMMSSPAGAEVRAGDRVLGTTPTFVDLPPGERVTLVFHRDGYFEETEELVPVEGAIVNVTLRPRRRGRSSDDEGSTLPIKTEL